MPLTHLISERYFRVSLQLDFGVTGKVHIHNLVSVEADL